MTPSPLTVGFLIEEKNELPAWEYELLLDLLKATFIAEVVLIYVETSSSEKQVRQKESLAFRLFKVFENAWFRKLPDASCIMDLTGLENNVHGLRTMRIASGPDLSAEKIDLLYISYSLKDYSMPKIPEYGLWQIQFGNNRNPESDLPAFWEVMHNEIVTTAQLKVSLEGEGSERIMYNAVSSTVPFSVKNNFNAIAWKASQFLSLRLKELYLTGRSPFFHKYEKNIFEYDHSHKEDVLQKPFNLFMLWLFLRNSSRYLMYKIQQLMNHKRFILLYARGKLDIFDMDIEKFIELVPPGTRFWADPFVIEKGKEHFIFFEESESPGGKGRLAVMKISSDNRCSSPQVILERPYHLSYPFIFENNGEYYLMPESSANRTVELYRCKKFPFEWEFLMYLLQDVNMTDPTLFFFQNLWWLFVNTRAPKSSTSNDQLMIYYRPDIFTGEWTPHSGNPVITDVSNCRPAGKIFMVGERIFRPAQNNASRQYGYSVRINEIEVLTTTEYRERLVYDLSPADHKRFAAVHTLNASADLIVIDAILV